MAKKKYSRALKVRGGFATPGSAFRTRPVGQRDIVAGGWIKDPKGEFTKMALKTALSPKGKAMLDKKVQKASEVAIKTGVRGILVLKTNISNGNVEADKTSLIVESESKKRVNNNMRGSVNPALRYAVKLNTGNPTSKSITRYMANNGSREITLANSLKSSRYTTGGLKDREFSVIKAGFNQKIFYANADFQTSLKEVSTLYGLTNPNGITGLEKYADQVAYGLSSSLKEKLSFSNLNSYMAMDLKIHLVVSKATKAEIYEPGEIRSFIRHLTGVSSGTVYNYNDYFGANRVIKEVSAYPDFAGSITDTNAYYCLVDPSTTIRSSNVFNQSHEVLHTVSQRLQPGDMLDMTNEIALGSGIILNDLYTRLKVAESLPSYDADTIPLIYTYVIEAVGQKCIGYSTSGPTQNEPFHGTSPFVLSTEHSQQLTLGIQNIQGQNNAPNEEGWLDDRYAVKVFTSNDFSLNIPTNIIYNKDYDAADFVIKTLSDRVAVTAAPTVPIP
jgi:hypothetical protein